MCWTPWSVLQKKKAGAVCTSTRADACASAGDPQLSSHRCRFQTGENRFLTTLIEGKSITCYASGTREDFGNLVERWRQAKRKNLNKQTGCAVRSLPQFRRTIGITLINRLVRQCICGLIEFTVGMPNIPRYVKR